MYESIPKSQILQEPQRYAWNILVCERQFTQEELLAVKEYLDLPTMIRSQLCLTRDFLEAHFVAEIDACLEVDWDDVEAALARSHSASV